MKNTQRSPPWLVWREVTYRVELKAVHIHVIPGFTDRFGDFKVRVAKQYCAPRRHTQVTDALPRELFRGGVFLV